jgi:hypothetical protein
MADYYGVAARRVGSYSILLFHSTTTIERVLTMVIG